MNLSSNQQFVLLLVSICGVIMLISRAIGKAEKDDEDDIDNTEEIK